MALCITFTARAVKAVLQRPVARAMLPNSLVGVASAAAAPYAPQLAPAIIHHCLSMSPAGQRAAFSTTAASGAAPVVTQPIVLVKIGVDGNDRSLSLTYDALIRMDAAVLLQELAKSVRFSTELKDVPLSKCTVWLLPRVAGDEPTPQEEDAAVELRAAATIGELLSAQRWTPSRLLFLRVRLPVAASHVASAALDVHSPGALLASLDRVIPASARRRGMQLLAPKTLTSAAFLSGITAADAQASPATAEEGSRSAEPPRAQFIKDLKLTRSGTLLAIAQGLTERMVLREGSTSACDRLVNPLVAVQSAPGGGKSALLDALGVMSMHGEWDAELCPHEGMRNVLNTCMVIPITYNSLTVVDTTTYDNDVQTGLALRILYAAFVHAGASFSLEDLYKALPPGSFLGTATVVRACFLATKLETGMQRGLLLLVDELVKLLRLKAGAQLLVRLGSLLDSFSSTEVNVVCTTLDALMVNAERTSSGRVICWAPLPALSQETSEALFLRALRRSDHSMKALPPAVRITISDAAGHPRSLQYVLTAALSLKQNCARLDRLRTASLTAMEAPNHAAVVAALRGVKLDVDQTVAGTTMTLRDLITNGTFINSDVNEDNQAVVPKLSMLRLLRYAQTSAADTAAANAIRALATEEVNAISVKDRPTLSGSRFERFMMHWLALMTVIRGDESLTVLDLFHAELQLPDSCVDVRLRSPFSLKRVKLQGDAGRVFEAIVAEKPTKLRADELWCFGSSNPAFDVLLTAHLDGPQGGFLALAVETRLSDVGANQVDRDLRRKHAGFKMLVSSFKAMSPAPDFVVYVYAAVRPMKSAAKLQKQLAANGVLVLANTYEGQPASLATVQRALTPSLADRAFFELNLTGVKATASSNAKASGKANTNASGKDKAAQPVTTAS